MKILLLLLTLLCSVPVWAQKATDVLATAAGRNFTVSDLSPAAQDAVEKFPERLKQMRNEALAQKIGETLLEIEAKARNTTVAALLDAERTKVKDPTPAEIQAVYDANRDRIGDKALSDVRKQIVSLLRRDAEAKAVGSYVESLVAKHKLGRGKDVNAADLKPTDVLFIVGSRTYTAGEFESDIKLSMYAARADLYEELRDEVETAVYMALVNEEAKAQKMDSSDLLAREITAKMKEFSNAERHRFEAAFRERLFAKYNAKITLAEPEPVSQNISTDDDPSRGPANAPITVVMFSDYQCSACAATNPLLKTILTEYGDKVRLVVRDFPLENIHENAFNAARAAYAANAQGKFFEYVDVLYRNQTALDDASLRKYAAHVGLNAKQFELDFTSEKAAAEVRKDLADGRSYGVAGTPAIFVNGVSVRRLSAEAFRRAIDRALKR
jgi:protein-disulfide isomerase